MQRQSEFDAEMRAVLLSWCCEVCAEFRF